MTTFPETASIREVGPRDGLQTEKPLDPSDRADLITSLVDTGIMNIEAVSFVSPKAVPSMADPTAVLARLNLPPDVTVTALVPNKRGAEMALQTGIDALTMTISVSETYNQRNVHMSTTESLEQVHAVCDLIAENTSGDRTVPVDGVISCAFGSPYEGDIPPSDVANLCKWLRDAGVASITLADTTGMGTPRVLEDVLEATGAGVGLHLHDTRGTGLLNLYAALRAGVVRFDTSIGGLGGSPFAEGAGGNVATEDAVALLDDLGVTTGIDLFKLMAVSKQLEQLIGRPVPSRIAHAGPRMPIRP
ncbi:MAG: hydroxymethylglutaryl-CoA lyase [Acidimicrobiales bacterium]